MLQFTALPHRHKIVFNVIPSISEQMSKKIISIYTHILHILTSIIEHL